MNQRGRCGEPEQEHRQRHPAVESAWSGSSQAQPDEGSRCLANGNRDAEGLTGGGSVSPERRGAVGVDGDEQERCTDEDAGLRARIAGRAESVPLRDESDRQQAGRYRAVSAVQDVEDGRTGEESDRKLPGAAPAPREPWCDVQEGERQRSLEGSREWMDAGRKVRKECLAPLGNDRVEQSEQSCDDGKRGEDER